MNLNWHFNKSYINTHFDMFSKIEACMGVIYLLICVRKHESNLPTNICATAGKKTKCGLLSEISFLPDFITAWCVFFYQSVYFFTNGVYQTFITTLCLYDFCKTVLVKKCTPCQGVV